MSDGKRLRLRRAAKAVPPPRAGVGPARSKRCPSARFRGHPLEPSEPHPQRTPEADEREDR
jgi:hypothetical protein